MDQTLGKRIMENRKRLNLTQDKLAEKLDVTAQAVSKWENDQSYPDITIIPKLAEIFGISTDELLGHTNTEVIHEAEIIDEEEKEPEGIHVQNGKWELHWDGGKRSTIGAAVFFLTVGILYLLTQLLSWDLSLWDILWPTAILVFGIWGLFPRFSFFRLSCTLLGGYFLANNIFQFSYRFDGKLIAAILIVLFGLRLLSPIFRKNKKPGFTLHRSTPGKTQDSGGYSCTDDTFYYSKSFCEFNQYVHMDALQYGDIHVSFGEANIDLTNVKSVKPDCVINAQCSFGELNIFVPKRFEVIHDIGTSFAATSVQGTPNEHPEGKILIKGTVNFGETTIHYL